MKKTLLILSAIMVIAFALIYVFMMRSIAEQIITNLLRKNNIDIETLDIQSISSIKTTIGSIALGKDKALQIQQADITYTPTSLMKHRVSTINLQGVDITGAEKGGTLSFGSLDTLMPPDKGEGALALPFEHLTMDGRLHVLYKNVPLTIPFTLALAAEKDKIRADITAGSSFHFPGIVCDAGELSAHTLISKTANKIDVILEDATLTAKKLTLTSGSSDYTLSPLSLSIAKSTASISKEPFGGWSLTHQLLVNPLVQTLLITAKGGKPLKVRLVTSKLQLSGSRINTPYMLSVMINGALSLPDKSLIMDGIAGNVRFIKLAPLTTAPNQLIHVGKLIAGIALQDGDIGFQLTPQQLTIKPTEWHFQQGILGSMGMALNLNDLQNEHFTLTANNLELSDLVAMLIKKDIVTTGILSGTIPVRLVHGVPMIVNGKLSSLGGGLIQYSSVSSGLPEGNKNIQLLLTALRNFHYTALTIALNSKSADLVEADLTILGSNPEVYSGKTFQLQIHLQGNLTAILMSNSDAYHLPEKLQKQLMDSAE